MLYNMQQPPIAIYANKLVFIVNQYIKSSDIFFLKTQKKGCIYFDPENNERKTIVLILYFT